MRIAVAGKGGTGKTTFCALAVKALLRAGKAPILVVDADPNANLGEALGIEAGDSVADIVASADGQPYLPGGMTKERYLAYRIHQALAEGRDIDLLVMGGPEGAGCYCYVNNLLRGLIEELHGNYPVMIVDNEAGLEHLSRRTIGKADFLFILSDVSGRGILSARRVAGLVRRLRLDVGSMGLVIGRAPEGAAGALAGPIGKLDIPLWGIVPEDPEIAALDLAWRPLTGVGDNNAALSAVADILRNQGII